MSQNYTTTPDIVSYGLGRQVGDQFASDPFDGINAEAIAAGVMDALGGKPSPIDQETFTKAFQEINDIMQVKAAEKAQKAAEAGEAFLAENAKKEGVIVTESGLQYEILTEGSGDKPGAESVVSTHYHGTLVDGTVFDSSVERGQPAQFPVNRVIAGWTEALQMMPTGSKWRLYVPQELAYGAQGSGGKIAPYSALIFDVELLEILS
ncbi:MAG: FKBP-type peptidyl-prolyl cis-trans isomerase [Thiomicrorhabdus chilensis]|uniref:FKBP-type peptidyl-prolyl cis-trans isomerase n=1 Tax=Thiomicrorhabdus chilensis TaxID=63656 RepID=UPI00041DA69A|nr:FKBP-type peptidyl-prolyl cis-trans isomerase [Thiomicrorhabdus chilensis]MDX1348124.1 FKBP-type peptidyl-prolyl cis-trans isomerase [Thiomicrorhabdus chilensis]